MKKVFKRFHVLLLIFRNSWLLFYRLIQPNQIKLVVIYSKIEIEKRKIKWKKI